jgi:HAD superfamily hydrolase (TIGR01549 family)
MGGDKLLRSVAGIEAETSLGKSISAARQRIFTAKYLPNLKPFAQADELLERMHDAGYRLAVASSAKKQELDSLLAICGADRFVAHKTSSDDAENSKPDPDIVHAALHSIDLPAEEVLLLGDTPYDIEASREAGVGTVAVRCGGWQDFDLEDALAIYDNPADLLAHFDQSPFTWGLS